jgi:hypothetical protein
MLNKTAPSRRIYSPKPPALAYTRTFRVTGFRGSESAVTSHRSAALGPVTVTDIQTSAQFREKTMKSFQERRELLKELEIRNMNPVILLGRLAESCTPYAHLIKMAAEEFRFSTGPARSQKVDDLERESAVDSAKKEVEIQQLAQKLARIRTEGAEIRNNLARRQKKLDNLNKDIERLNHLAHLSGVTAQDLAPPPTRNMEFDDEGLEPPKGIPLDDAKYKLLWTEHTQLVRELGDLKEELLRQQVQQMIVFRERARNLISGGLYRRRR